MLEQNPRTDEYRLGLAVFELGTLVRRKLDLLFEARPWLATLRDRTGETVDLSVLNHDIVICVNFLESDKVSRIRSGLGLRMPAHCTAEGKALMAFQPPQVVDRIIAAGLEQRTPLTVTNPAALREELSKVRARGYAIDDERYVGRGNRRLGPDATAVQEQAAGDRARGGLRGERNFAAPRCATQAYLNRGR
jgi:DNA-binding IclR family transcriptional regulator